MSFVDDAGENTGGVDISDEETGNAPLEDLRHGKRMGGKRNPIAIPIRKVEAMSYSGIDNDNRGTFSGIGLGAGRMEFGNFSKNKTKNRVSVGVDKVCIRHFYSNTSSG